MGDLTIKLRLRFWTSYSDRNKVPSVVIRTALAALDAAGVAMPFPTKELRISGEIGTNSPEDSER